MASAGGPDNLVMLDPAKYKARPQVPEPAGDGSATQLKWQVGEQEYEAFMRMLDNLVSMKKTSLCHPAVPFPSRYKLIFCRRRFFSHLPFFSRRATERATLTAARHCETKQKSTVTPTWPPPATGVTRAARTVTQALAPR